MYIMLNTGPGFRPIIIIIIINAEHNLSICCSHFLCCPPGKSTGKARKGAQACVCACVRACVRVLCVCVHACMTMRTHTRMHSCTCFSFAFNVSNLSSLTT